MSISARGYDAAAEVVTRMQRENEGYVAPYDEWLPQAIEAYLTATNLQGAVNRIERLENALRWYANPANFPHEDYTARAKAALATPRGR